MALTPEQIGRVSKPYGKNSIQGFDHILAFARAIEAEVRKDDEALIRQLRDALEKADKISGYPNNRKAIAAANARLGEKEGT